MQTEDLRVTIDFFRFELASHSYVVFIFWPKQENAFQEIHCEDTETCFYPPMLQSSIAMT